MQRFPEPETPEDLMEIANALQASGLYNEAAQATKMATEMRDSITAEKRASDTSQTMTNYMQDLRDIAQFQLSCDFNDPECAKKAQQLWLDQKRAGPDERYQSKFAEAEAEAFSQDLSDSVLMSREASYYESTINQSLGFLNEGLYTGTGSETINKLKKIGVAFGMVDPGATATAEQFRVNSMKAIMAWVQKTKGAISEAEMKLFADASEGLSRTVAGNKLILLTAKSLAEYQQRLHAERVQWLKDTDNPTRLKWEAHVIGWNVENGNMLPTADEIAEALEQPVPSEQAVIESDEIIIKPVD